MYFLLLFYFSKRDILDHHDKYENFYSCFVALSAHYITDHSSLCKYDLKKSWLLAWWKIQQKSKLSLLTVVFKGDDVMLCIFRLHLTILSECTTGKHHMARAGLVVGERISTPVLQSEDLYTSKDALGYVQPIVILISLSFVNWKISIRKKSDIGNCDWWHYKTAAL